VRASREPARQSEDETLVREATRIKANRVEVRTF